MPTIDIKYVVYTGRSRRPRRSLEILYQLPLSNQTVGDTFSGLVPQTMSRVGTDVQLPFAFMSIVGANDGNQIVTSSGPYSVSIGSSDVKILAVYGLSSGSIGGGSPSILVDAFNVDTGIFSDSDFIEVFENGVLNISKSQIANEIGAIATDNIEELKAFSSIDNNVSFLQWEKLLGNNDGTNRISSNINIIVQSKESGVFFAFYKSKNPMDLLIWIREFELKGEITGGPNVDGGGVIIGPNGKPIPIEPWTWKLFSQLAGIIVSLSKDSAIKETQKKDLRLFTGKQLDAIITKIRSIKF
jgi:hypothetical protein